MKGSRSGIERQAEAGEGAVDQGIRGRLRQKKRDNRSGIQGKADAGEGAVDQGYRGRLRQEKG